MVTALSSGWSGSGSRPGHAGTLCNVLSTTHFILTVPLSNLVYKCVPANLMLCDEASTPPGGAEIPKKPLLKLTRDMEDPPGYV